jgi:hypothetical protein
MNRVVGSALAIALSAGCLLASPPANADPLCREGYYLPSSGLLCVPDPNYVAPQAAPAQPAPRRSLLDRVLGRNRPAPAAPAPAAPPAAPAPVVAQPPVSPAPAPPPDNSAGGNSGGDNGLLGQVGVLPGGGTCSPGAVIVILGSNQTCPPPGVYTVPTQPGTVVITRQPPTAAQALIPDYHLPVTH